MTSLKENEQSKAWDFYGTIFFAVLSYLITFFIVVKQMNFSAYIDYQAHADSALALTISNYFTSFLNSPYLMWHTLTKLICKITGDTTAVYASAIVTGLFIAATYVVVSRYMRHFGGRGACIMAFASCVIGPLYMPWIVATYYKGVGSPNTWHNPTNIAVKTFAALALIYSVGIIKKIKEGEKIQIKEMILFMVIIFLGVFAKPSFAMSFVPALGIWILISCICEKFKNIKGYLLLCALFIPAMLLIGFQYLSFFGEDTGSGVGIELFRAVKNYTSHPLLATFLVLAFPLVFLLFNIKKEWKRYDTQLVVINTAIGWVMRSVLYETGLREKHGNFGWAYMIALFLLYIVCMGHFLEDLRSVPDDKKILAKNGVIFGIMCIQILFGIIYIYRLIIVSGVWI